MATVDTVWRATDTKPGDIDAALRSSLSQIHRDNAGSGQTAQLVTP